MYNGILYYLTEYEKNSINSRSLRYTSFNKGEQREFNKKTELKIWLLSKGQYQIYTDLSEINVLKHEPIIYHLPPDKFYLIQRTEDGDFYRAITIAIKWYQEYINVGNTAEKYSNIIDGYNVIPKTTILTLNKSGKLIITNVDSKSLYILHHNDMFSAILPF